MKTLYESILSDVDANLERGNNDVEKVITFGKRFVFERAIVGSASGDILNAISLKKLTNGMDYMSDKIDRGQFDKRGKVKMFANLIDHLSLADLEVNIMGNTGEDFRKDLTVKLNKYCKDNNVFINDDKVHMWVVSERATGKDELHIIVARTDKYGNSYMFKLAYKIE
jgi:hypothetical protein